MKTQRYLNRVSEVAEKNAPYVDVDAMFAREEMLKKDFKEHFRNISRIMDCVGCSKCRLGGKIQTQGIGTALKILFSFDDTGIESSNFQLHRSEIIALFNAVGRYSESLASLETFRALMKTRRNESEKQRADSEFMRVLVEFLARPVWFIRQHAPKSVVQRVDTLSVSISKLFQIHVISVADKLLQAQLGDAAIGFAILMLLISEFLAVIT